MKFLKKVYDVKHFAISNDYVGIITIYDKFILEGSDVREDDFSYPEISRSVYSYGNYIIFSDIQNICSVVIDLKYKRKFKLNYLISFPFSIDNFTFNNYLFSNIRTKIKENAKIKITSFEIESVYPINYGVNGIWKIIDDRKFISIDKDRIFIHSFVDGDILWQHSFSELLEGEKIETVGDIIVYNGSLFLPLKDDKNSKLGATIEIDIETGGISKVYKDFYGQLYLHNNELFEAFLYEVKRLCINTGKMMTYNFEDILKPLNLQIHWNKSVIENNKLYFIDGHWATTNRMGIIDLNTQELIWQKDFDINDGINNSIMEIKVSNGRMFVHCSDNTLHIFEKE